MHTTPNLFSELLCTVNPTWYFTLETAVPVFADVSKLPKEVQNLVDMQVQYSEPVMQKADAAYQLLKKGWVDVTPDNSWYPELVPVKPVDRYTFLRRFYKKQWVWYTCIRRLLALHNPVTELMALYSTRNVTQVKLYDALIPFNPARDVTSDVPPVSIIIPTLNRYEYLNDVLNDLQKQTLQNFEVLVIDQSEPFQASFYENRNLDIRVIQQQEKALWQARNRGVTEARYEWVLFAEDDIRIMPDWIEKHFLAVRCFQAEVSSGVFFPTGKQMPADRKHFRIAEQFSSANALVKMEVFRKTGLLDLQFEKQRMGDGEFGLRCFQKGIQIISNPFACCEDVKAPVGGLRQMGSWDGFRPKKWFSPRPIPSVIYLYRR